MSQKRTNPIGKDTKNLSVNIPQDLHKELKRLAKDSGKKLGKYVRELLTIAADQGIRTESRVEYTIAYSAKTGTDRIPFTAKARKLSSLQASDAGRAAALAGGKPPPSDSKA